MMVLCSELVIERGNIIMDLILILDGLYIVGSSNKREKYRMLPSKITNEGLPVLIWLQAVDEHGITWFLYKIKSLNNYWLSIF